MLKGLLCTKKSLMFDHSVTPTIQASFFKNITLKYCTFFSWKMFSCTLYYDVQLIIVFAFNPLIYCSLNELLRDQYNGLVFKDHTQLSHQLEVRELRVYMYVAAMINSCHAVHVKYLYT